MILDEREREIVDLDILLNSENKNYVHYDHAIK